MIEKNSNINSSKNKIIINYNLIKNINNNIILIKNLYNGFINNSKKDLQKCIEEFKSNDKVKISSIFLASLLCFSILKLVTNSNNDKNIITDNIENFTDLAKEPNTVSYDIIGNENDNEINKEIPFIAYVVKDGEDINSIAKEFNVSAMSILKINQLDSSDIKAGTSLILPKIQVIDTKEEQEKDQPIQKVFTGIDVSEHQGKIDWEKAQKYIDYAIVRVCDFGKKDKNGNVIIDKQFSRNIQECNRLGIPVGVYSFTRANNKKEAIAEANYVLNAIKDYKVDYPVYFDIEAEKHKNMIANNINNAIELTERYCKTIENNNYYVGIYSSNSMLNKLTNNSKALAQYDKWIANFGANKKQAIEDVQPKTINFGSTYYMQQASSKATIPGINGYVDVDFGYLDFSKIIDEANLNKPKQKTR